MPFPGRVSGGRAPTHLPYSFLQRLPRLHPCQRVAAGAVQQHEVNVRQARAGHAVGYGSQAAVIPVRVAPELHSSWGQNVMRAGAGEGNQVTGPERLSCSVVVGNTLAAGNGACVGRPHALCADAYAYLS